MSVHENDETSAVSIENLEEEGVRKANDKVYCDLFVSFIDFRLLDTYDLVKVGSNHLVRAKIKNSGATNPNENQVQFVKYEGKKDLRHSKTLSVSYPSAHLVNTQGQIFFDPRGLPTSFNQGEYPGDLVYRQYCLLPAPKIYQKGYYYCFTGATRFHSYIYIIYTYTTIHYLKHPDLFPHLPRSSGGRASVDLF